MVLRSARSVAVGYHLHELALVPDRRGGAAASGTSGPTCSATDWDPAEAVRRIAAEPDDDASPRPCSTSATWPGSATSTRRETLFLRGLWPWTPVGEVPDLPALVELAQKLVASNRGRWTQTTTGSLRRGETTYVLRPPGPAVPPLRHGDPEGGAGRTGHLLVPCAASRNPT